MGWEKRGQKTYYYRKRRVDGRVVTEYCGTGRRAQRAAAADRKRRMLRAREEVRLAQAKIERERLRMLMQPIDETVEALTEALLLLGGFHTHKRQWRKKRERIRHDADDHGARRGGAGDPRAER